MNDETISQAQAELKKMRSLVDNVDEIIGRQSISGSSTRPENIRGSNDELLRIITQMKHTLDGLTRSVELQEKEREQLHGLQEVGAIINSSLDRSEVLNIVMDTIIQLTGAERSFLMLYDQETGELEVEVARNINQETIDQSSFEISRSIVKSVAESAEPVVTTNAQADPRFSGQESIISYNLRSILCVPLKIKDNTIGVIYADNRIVSGIFVDQDRDLLAAFSNQAAVAIENARLFRQIKDQLADITEMKNLQDDVFGSIASGVITIDTLDRISLINRAAERILGVPTDKVIEKNYRRHLLAPIGDVVESVIEKVKSTGGHQNMEVDATLQNQKGTSTLNLTFTPLRDISQQTQGVTLVLDDISEKKRLESVRRYLPPALVDQVRDVDTAQQPQRRDITVFFADIRGYSTVSELIEPEMLIEVINNYLTLAAQQLNKYEGLIDKYDGDAVMALFNTRLNPQENHAMRAVRTAFGLREDILAYHKIQPNDQILHFGIGINTGDAVVGNVGSPLRKDYSAIGDAVNLAKRLQEMAKPSQILLSEQTYSQVRDSVIVEALEPSQVKGRKALEQFYELVDIK